MRTQSLLRWGGPALLALGAGCAIYGVYRQSMAEQALATVCAERKNLEESVRQAQASIVADRLELTRRQSLKTGPARKASAAGRNSPARNALLVSHPKLFDLFLKSYQANLRQDYGVFYAMAGLSADQIQRFEDLATNHQAQLTKILASAETQGLDKDNPSTARLMAAANQQFQADQTALLGPDGAQQLAQFNLGQGALSLANGAALHGLESADAYSPAQAAQLMQVIADASSSYQQGGQFDGNSVDWDSVQAQAAKFLTPPQLTALQRQADAVKLVSQLVPNYLAQHPSK